MKRLSIILSIFLVSVSLHAGDVLTLNNLMAFDGKVVRIKNCVVVFKAEGKKYLVPADEIFSLQFKNTDDKVYRNYLQMVEGDSTNKCLNGSLDAQAFHGKKGGHFALGFLFGPFAMIGTAIAKQTPEKGRRTYMLSTHKDQFSDPEYLKCYKKKAKGQLIGMEVAGWATWILLVVIINAI
jgi:hypothetical protein